MKGLNIESRFDEEGQPEVTISFLDSAAVLTEEQALAVARVLIRTVEEMRKLPEYVPQKERVLPLIVNRKTGSLLNFEGANDEP